MYHGRVRYFSHSSSFFVMFLLTICAEYRMISGVPLFRGRDNNDQLNQILRILGTPDEATLRRIATESVRDFDAVTLAQLTQTLGLTARDSASPVPSNASDSFHLALSKSSSGSVRFARQITPIRSRQSIRLHFCSTPSLLR